MTASSSYLIPGLLLCFALRGQDMHFTQMNQNPSLLNPALTGASGGYRGSLSYRGQWGSVSAPYKTFGASAELRFRTENWEQVNKFQTMTFKEKLTGRIGAGFSVYNDAAGDGKLGLTLSNISLSSFIPLSRSSFFSAGLQAGLGQKRITAANLVFPDQYNGSRYDASVRSRERYATDTYTYPDFGAGLLWCVSKSDKVIGTNRQLRAKAGISAFHLARPRTEFLNTTGRLERRYVAHAEILKDINNSAFCWEASITSQLTGPSGETLAGLFIRCYFNSDSRYTGYVKRSCIGGGLYFRNRDAVIPALILDWQDQYTLFMTYDVNVSGLSTASRLQGAFELSLRIVPPRAFLYEMKSPN
jgi:type IX secretion system PorP/SprF family membrane protein